MSIEWDGNGLPPVGAKVIVDVCYFTSHPLLKELQGKEVEIVFHSKAELGDDCAVFRWSDNGNGYLYHGLVAGNFKPIKSERTKAIEEMFNIYKKLTNANTIEIIESFYDAGYRKIKE